MKESETKLTRFLKKKGTKAPKQVVSSTPILVLETLAALQENTMYLSGLKWKIVKDVVMECMMDKEYEADKEKHEVSRFQNSLLHFLLNPAKSTVEQSCRQTFVPPFG